MAIAMLPMEILFGSLPDATNAFNFATPMAQGFFIFCELAYTYFSVFNLWAFGLYIAFWLVISFIKIVMAIANFVKGLLPLILRLFV
jgi:hypothetical protein